MQKRNFIYIAITIALSAFVSALVVSVLILELRKANAREYITICDGQAIANAIWRTPIEDHCVGDDSAFRNYILEVSRP